MARIIGTPGESAAARGLLTVTAVVTISLLLIVAPSVYALLHYAEKWGFAGIALTLAVIAASVRWKWAELREIPGLLREGGQFLKGAEGERRVAQTLVGLPDTYIVFHDFHPVDRATGRHASWNVDHIVVGPTGVFVIDAKNWRGSNIPAARRSARTRKAAEQAQRNAYELKQGLERWSAGALSGLFVVPVVIFTQDGAHTENVREGTVRTLPLRLLAGEIKRHVEGAIDQEKAGRIARVLFAQMPGDLQMKFKPEFDAFSGLSREERYRQRDARLAAQAAGSEAALPPAFVPTVCPECGGKLVRRVARKGDRAGKPFLGCENFRDKGCRYGFNLEE